MSKKLDFEKWWASMDCPSLKGVMQYIDENGFPVMGINRIFIKKWLKEFKEEKAQENKKEKGQSSLKLTDESLLKEIVKPIDILYLAKKYDISVHDIMAKVECLIKSGYNIKLDGIFLSLNKAIVHKTNEVKSTWDGQRIIKFGVVSDNHLCCKHQQLTFLQDLYDLFQKEGVTDVYNAGDVTDGYYQRRAEHVYELIAGLIGVDQQAEYVTNVYPKRDGITTHVIGGNHDETHIINGGADILKRISSEREDINYLGNGSAVINLTDNCKLELLHPLDGASYALSYSSQKYIDSLSGGEKPNILIIGHHHKALYSFYRNIHTLEAGTTCGQSKWMKRKRISAHVGGWIVTVHLDKEGTITRFQPEFMPLYKIRKEDY